MGFSALRQFKLQHKCNDLCTRLKLKEPSPQLSLKLREIRKEVGLDIVEESLPSVSHLQAKKKPAKK